MRVLGSSILMENTQLQQAFIDLFIRYYWQMYSDYFKSLKNQSGPILVTGHTGFKGAWLTLMLDALGIDTCGYSLAPKNNSLYNSLTHNKNFREKISDIRDVSSVQEFIEDTQPSIVIHLAAQALVLESYKNPRLTFETNAGGTFNILESSFRCDSVKAVLIVTSDKVYKNRNDGKRFIESDPLEGNDPYSASKVAAESVAQSWRKIRETADGPKVFVARAGNVIGGGDLSQHRLLPDLVRSFSTNKKLTIRNPYSTRPWQHVIDPLFGYLRYLEHGLMNDIAPALNFGPVEKSLTVGEVAKIASKAWGNQTNLEYSNDKSEFESQSLDLDSKLALTSLKWSPKWTQNESVASTISWWKKVLVGKQTPLQCCLDDIERYFE